MDSPPVDLLGLIATMIRGGNESGRLPFFHHHAQSPTQTGLNLFLPFKVPFVAFVPLTIFTRARHVSGD